MINLKLILPKTARHAGEAAAVPAAAPRVRPEKDARAHTKEAAAFPLNVGRESRVASGPARHERREVVADSGL